MSKSLIFEPMIVAKDEPSRSRFCLKKRPIHGSKENLSSCHSDFLDGLFADVAKATEMAYLGKRECSTLDSSDSLHCVPPTKKSRSSSPMRRSRPRIRTSVLNLAELCESQQAVGSPRGINEIFGYSNPSALSSDLTKSRKQSSLSAQLSCLEKSKVTTVTDTAKIAFPNLPATVSDSSCSSGLTRANLVRNVSNRENEGKDSFGWFVDLDENQANSPEPPTATLTYAVSSENLAFQAPTAPKHVNDVAELEWAKAADTIDDVLGDFF